MRTSKTPAKQTVGILGGMGPEATLDLLQRVINLTPAQADEDHIRMVIDCDPAIPSRIKAIIEGSGPSPAPALIAMAKGLIHQGADFLAIPCNTAHHYIGEITAASAVPVVNMLDNAALRVHGAAPGAHRVGLLASTAIQITSLYDRPFAARDKTLVFPDASSQERLMALIMMIKGKRAKANTAELLDCAQGLIAQGADCLLIACTELSLLADTLAQLPVPVFDSADLLAREIVARALGEAAHDRQPNASGGIGNGIAPAESRSPDTHQ